MRTIKFRAQDIASNKWLYGDLRHHKDDVCIFEQEGNKGEQVKRDTIGQYTGMHDKNGKEIYEGDIIYSEFSDGSHTRCLVGWNDEKTCFGIMHEYVYRFKLQGYDFPEFDSRLLSVFRKDGKIFEVIGNIHDNPGLINK